MACLKGLVSIASYGVSLIGDQFLVGIDFIECPVEEQRRQLLMPLINQRVEIKQSALYVWLENEEGKNRRNLNDPWIKTSLIL